MKAIDYFEILRPFSWTASLIPVAISAILAFQQGYIKLPLLFTLFPLIILVQGAGNIINEYYDVKNNIDNLNSNNASTVILEKRIKAERALKIAYVILIIFLLGAIIYSFLFKMPAVFLFALIGVFAACFYTAPPFNLKYRGLGTLCIFLTFGVILPKAVFYLFSSFIKPELFWYFIPVAFLVTAIVHANNLADLKTDKNIITLARVIGSKNSVYLYILLIIAAYFMVIMTIINDLISIYALIIFITLPLAFENVKISLYGLKGEYLKIKKLDIKTAKLHFVFGVIWSLLIFFLI